jgi:hypothetical protein
VARYRLRLQLQEFDVPPGETVVGRSPECHVTIDDPLVSREHAKIFNHGDRVVLRDLGSRNGSKLNGEVVKAKVDVELKDGDRLRFGNQEIVFSAIVAAKRPPRPTGSLRHCRQCHVPYLAEAPSCPHCGHVPGVEETLSGNIKAADPIPTGGPVDRQNWSLLLQVELLDKAISLSRTGDADRVLKGIAAIIEDRIAHGQQVDVEPLEPALSSAVRLCALSGEGLWAGWVLQTLERLGRMPKPQLVSQIAQLPPILVDEIAPQLEAFVAFWNERSDALEGAPMHALGTLSVLRDESIARRAKTASRARG